jgi:hypothetical protein
LYNWLSAINCTPGPDNSSLIRTEKAVPTNPENSAYIKYDTPISLAFEDKNHLSNHMLIPDVFTFNMLYLSVSDEILTLLTKYFEGSEWGVTLNMPINVS